MKIKIILIGALLSVLTSCTTVNDLRQPEARYIGKSTTILTNASLNNWVFQYFDTEDGCYVYKGLEDQIDIRIYVGKNADKVYMLKYIMSSEIGPDFFIYMSTLDDCTCIYDEKENEGICKDKDAKYLFDFGAKTTEVVMLRR